MILRRLLFILFTVALPLTGWAQGIVTVGIPQHLAKKTKTHTMAAARSKQPLPDTLQLPFWDDFSATNGTQADTSLWFWGQSVTINDGMAIRPPSLKTATFDGIDSVGNPYNVNDVLAKGYADKLVSQPIDLTTVDEANRNTVYLSYRYQIKGNGELPDAGDRLLVMFLDSLGAWIPADTIESDGTLDPTLFYSSFVHVSGSKFFHPGFKFRIQNFARLSGPYDSWHVDYIYLNKGRSSSDNYFPDRTISEPLTSLLGDYTKVPIDHFLLKRDIITQPTMIISNQRPDQVNPAGQPILTEYTLQVSYRDNGVVVDEPLVGPTISDSLTLGFNTFPEMTVYHLPDFADIPTTADSLAISLEMYVNTDDNIIKTPTEGDYDPAIWFPIDFRHNDTTRATYILKDKYAYDDGVAEYGAGLNQPGAQIAYEYRLVGVKQENVTFIEMYFPRFGDESSQVINLRIWNNLSEPPVYAETTTVQRSEDNIFWVKQLAEAVPVDSVFYIGWKQDAAAVIAVGLDKNTNSGDRMWSNINGDWVKNTLIQGSLMMRPVFGEGPDGPVGLEDEKALTIYPNPSSGTFYFAGEAEMISVYDMTGRSIPFSIEATREETKLLLPNASQGIYIIKAHIDGRMRTAKVMVR